jgi:hypothetical protein
MIQSQLKESKTNVKGKNPVEQRVFLRLFIRKYHALFPSFRGGFEKGSPGKSPVSCTAFLEVLHHAYPREMAARATGSSLSYLVYVDVSLTGSPLDACPTILA